MTDNSRCAFNAFQDCNCGANCRSAAVDLGRFKKTEPPFIKPSTKGLLVVMTFGIVMAVSAYAVFAAANEGHRIEIARNV